MKQYIVILIAAALIGGAFYTGWALRGPHVASDTAEKKSPSSAAVQHIIIEAQQPPPAVSNESTSLYKVTVHGDTKTVASVSLKVSLTVPKDWVLAAASGAPGIQLGPHTAPALLSIFGATSDPLQSDPQFVDGTSRGFVAMLGLPDGKRISIGNSSYIKLKQTSIGGHEGSIVVEPSGERVTWVRSEGLNWYITQTVDSAGETQAVNTVLASIVFSQ